MKYTKKGEHTLTISTEKSEDIDYDFILNQINCLQKELDYYKGLKTEADKLGITKYDRPI